MNKFNIDTSKIKVGDIVFIAISNYLYRKVAECTNSWTSHVGWVHSHNGEDFMVAESSVPLSRITTLSQFIDRSEGGQFAVRRLRFDLTDKQIKALQVESQKRLGKWYHLGFKYESSRQFCSKFVYDVYRDALGVEVGQLQTFSELLNENPGVSLTFWRLWYFGFIPWDRVTITPGIQYKADCLETVFEANIKHSQAI